MSARDYLARNLAPKAAFDLQCPESQLQFVNMGPVWRDRVWWDGSKEVSVDNISDQQGVTGCEKRARYVFAAGGWVLNGAIQPSEAKLEK